MQISRPRFELLICASLYFVFLCCPVQAAAEISLPQADGSTLELNTPSERLVTLSPHLAELVFAAGAGRHLIATVEYSEYPSAAIDIPRIGDAFRIDVERVLSLKPDLVIAWDSGNPKQATDQLHALGIPVWRVEIREPAEIADMIELIGLASEEQATAGTAAGLFRRRLAALSSRYGSVQTLDFFYQVDVRPLFTINGEHLISKGLSLCGGRNIFHDQNGLAFNVAHESVIVADPDVLIAPFLDKEADPLAVWHGWPGMQAVQQDALFLLPADKISRATPRLLDALELACSLFEGLRERSNNE
jgi:iron complex transport system substrate-binding protein